MDINTFQQFVMENLLKTDNKRLISNKKHNLIYGNCLKEFIKQNNKY